LASIDLPLVWAAIRIFAVLAYVLLDGFDLGVGILFAVERNPDNRDLMVNSIAPVWDGNETWLVLGGGGLFAVFPLAYSVILPALYPPIIAMLLGPVFRGVAFEFRFRTTGAGRAWWDAAFFLGSVVAALCQGLVLGGLLQGIHVAGTSYSGGWWDWLTRFTGLCGLAVVVGYALLGSCWLIRRTEGALYMRCQRYARTTATAVLALIVVVTLWTPMLQGSLTERWFLGLT
jgi:cytochrome d ubiquinol oxidase subunit II